MRILWILPFAIVAGCASLANQTVGHVGCSEAEITTANKRYSGPLDSTLTWDATCKGHSYICARHTVSSAGQTTTYETACSERVVDPATPPAPAPSEPPPQAQ